MKNIIENATIIYKNGLKKIFDAISISDKGVFTGYIKSNSEIEKFVCYSYIPKDQIEKIMVLNENNQSNDIDFNKNFNAEVEKK
jgi:hypothetical protein